LPIECKNIDKNCPTKLPIECKNIDKNCPTKLPIGNYVEKNDNFF